MKFKNKDEKLKKFYANLFRQEREKNSLSEGDKKLLTELERWVRSEKSIKEDS